MPSGGSSIMPPPATGGSAPSGTYSLENASTGNCLAEYNAGFGDLVTSAECGSKGNGGTTFWYAWTYSPGANGTFRLVNRHSGRCLQPGGTTTRPTPRPTTKAPAPPPPTSSAPSGTYSLKNASDGTCLGEYNAGFGVFANTYECGSPQGTRPIWYGWTYQAGANGTFRLVNRQSGHCLDPDGTTGATAVPCDGSSDQSWRIQATTANGRTLMNVGKGKCIMAGPPFTMMATCDPGDLRQLWRNVSPI